MMTITMTMMMMMMMTMTGADGWEEGRECVSEASGRVYHLGLASLLRGLGGMNAGNVLEETRCDSPYTGSYAGGEKTTMVARGGGIWTPGWKAVPSCDLWLSLQASAGDDVDRREEEEVVEEAEEEGGRYLIGPFVYSPNHRDQGPSAGVELPEVEMWTLEGAMGKLAGTMVWDYPWVQIPFLNVAGEGCSIQEIIWGWVGDGNEDGDRELPYPLLLIHDAHRVRQRIDVHALCAAAPVDGPDVEGNGYSIVYPRPGGRVSITPKDAAAVAVCIRPGPTVGHAYMVLRVSHPINIHRDPSLVAGWHLDLEVGREAGCVGRQSDCPPMVWPVESTLTSALGFTTGHRALRDLGSVVETRSLSIVFMLFDDDAEGGQINSFFHLDHENGRLLSVFVGPDRKVSVQAGSLRFRSDRPLSSFSSPVALVFTSTHIQILSGTEVFLDLPVSTTDVLPPWMGVDGEDWRSVSVRLASPVSYTSVTHFLLFDRPLTLTTLFHHTLFALYTT